MNGKTLEQALDEVVDEIKSAPKEDYFDIKERIQGTINDRAKFIASTLLEAVNSYPDVNLIPDIHSMYNLNCSIRKWTETTYPPNPDFKCPKTSLSWITVYTDYIELHVNKETDSWDEYDDGASWSYNKIPYELGMNGTRDDLVLFFTELFKEQADREEKRNNENLYQILFSMDYDVVRKIIDQGKPEFHKEFNIIMSKAGLNVH